MKVFVDSNVLLDVFGKREPFYADAARIWTLADRHGIEGMVSAISYTTVYYIIRKSASDQAARAAIKLLRDTFTTIGCDAKTVYSAMGADAWDFEDAVQYFSALAASADCIVTRDGRHFAASELPVMTPGEFLAAQFLNFNDQ